MNYKVICVDAKNRPEGILLKNWVEEGETYTVVFASNMAKQKMVLGVKLAEVSLPEGSEYEYYLAERFRPLTDEDLEAEEAVKQLLQETLEEDLELVPVEIEEDLRVW